jgi:hypothetical protein
MTIEYDDKGKFYTNRITKTAKSVIIQTTIHLIRGYIHVKLGERIKDELDNDVVFLAVTNATIYDAKGYIAYHTPFLSVQRGQIVWIMPAEDATKTEDGK